MSQIGTNYAQALYSLSKDEGLEETILGQLQVLCDSFTAEPAFLKLLAAPNIAKEERCRILDDSFRGTIAPYVLNFLKILTEKGYIRHFPDCCKAYQHLYNEDHNILNVRSVTAVALTPDQTQKLTDKLQTITGKTILLTNRVDPEVMGGVRLDYDGKRVDGTVQNRLNTIHALLKNTVL